MANFQLIPYIKQERADSLQKHYYTPLMSYYMYRKSRECMVIVTIDLHGYTCEAAHTKMVEGLTNALEYGEQVVRIIHGQGKHSEVFPVIKSMVRHWLEESDFARENVASVFRGEEGSPYSRPNPGETIVLLKSFANYQPELDYEAEEEYEARRISKKIRAGRLRTLRRRR